jgi:hypothetical protein
VSRGDKVQRRRGDMRHRGVRVSPLPRFMHGEFSRFCQELRCHAQSHYATWRTAIGYSDHGVVHANAIYWRSIVKYINHLEYLGTHGDDPRSNRGPAGTDGR